MTIQRAKRVIAGLAVAAFAAFAAPNTSNAGILTNTLLTDVSGTGALAWAYTEVGERIAYAATIARCETTAPCGAAASASASYIYDVSVSAGPSFYTATGLAPGSFTIPVFLDVFLLKTGNAQARVDAFGFSHTLGACCASTQYAATWGPQPIQDGSSFQVQLTAWAISNANHNVNSGPVVSVGWADPIVTIDPTWQYASEAANIVIDEQLTPLTRTSDGQRPPGVDLGEAEPPSVPLPPAAFLLAGALGLAGWHCRSRS